MKPMLVTVVVVFSFVLSACYLESEKQIITPEMQDNPWPGFSTVFVTIPAKNQFEQDQQFVVPIFPDNSIAVDQYVFSLAHSQKLSDLLGYKTLITSMPKDFEMWHARSPAEYDGGFYIAALTMNENGDIGIYTPSLSCGAFEIETFQDAENAHVECVKKAVSSATDYCKRSVPEDENESCIKKNVYMFEPGLIFEKGVRQ